MLRLAVVMVAGMLAGCAASYAVLPSPPPGPVAAPKAGPSDIVAYARGSACASHHWANGQGRAPSVYIEGVALVFARSLCHPERAEVVAASAPAARGGNANDGLDQYPEAFEALGMTASASPADMLRYSYTLLLGLGMEESSGRHCLGRWMQDPYSEHDSAEAGIFQTSYGARRYHPSLEPLYRRYRADESGCMLAAFSPGISCPEEDARNWGEGEGVNWQALTKRCPAFATEYAVVVLRHGGGARGEFGPMRRKTPEVVSDCNAMLMGVQTMVRDHPEVCEGL
jgi:hypothetical protein